MGLALSSASIADSNKKTDVTGVGRSCPTLSRMCPGVPDLSAPPRRPARVHPKANQAPDLPAYSSVSDVAPNKDPRMDTCAVPLNLEVSLNIEVIGLSFECLPPHDPVVVKTVHSGTWAGTMGITPGDVLLVVDGCSTKQMGREEFMHMMKQRPLVLTMRQEVQEETGEEVLHVKKHMGQNRDEDEEANKCGFDSTIPGRFTNSFASSQDPIFDNACTACCTSNTPKNHIDFIAALKVIPELKASCGPATSASLEFNTNVKSARVRFGSKVSPVKQPLEIANADSDAYPNPNEPSVASGGQLNGIDDFVEEQMRGPNLPQATTLNPQLLEIHTGNGEAKDSTFQPTNVSSYQPQPFSTRYDTKELLPDVKQMHEEEQVKASQGPEQFDLTKADSDVEDESFPYKVDSNSTRITTTSTCSTMVNETHEIYDEVYNLTIQALG